MLVNDVVDTKAIALAATNDASNDIPYLGTFTRQTVTMLDLDIMRVNPRSY